MNSRTITHTLPPHIGFGVVHWRADLAVIYLILFVIVLIIYMYFFGLYLSYTLLICEVDIICGSMYCREYDVRRF